MTSTATSKFGRFRSHLVLGVVWLGFAAVPAVAAPAIPEEPLPETIDYNRDVRPILSDTCFKCHGFDPATRKADLRLDTVEGATADLGGYAAVVPGKPDKSEAFVRLAPHDNDDLMPPANSGLKLTPRQIAIFKKWIEQGAVYKPHWSFIAPVRPQPPAVKDAAALRNPIDAFVRASLERQGTAPSPEADKPTLIRRVSLDLIGLPPTPAEVDAFLTDTSPDAFEKVVDRLLASPHFGERQAQFWLDAARYADSSGYQADWERTMWPWRDWVIQAFNRNQPFDQFTIEQLAGDMLPDATPDQRLATGFNRNHRINDEGGIIPEEYAVEYVIDRVETTSAVFLGLTTGCARCHDHKYDPLSQKEFYQLYAYFNNVPEKGQDGRAGYAAPFMRVLTPEQNAEIARLEKQADAIEKEIETDDAAAAERQKAWESATVAALTARKSPVWTVGKVGFANASGAEMHLQKDGSGVVMNVTTNEVSNYEFRSTPGLSRVTAVRLEAMTDPGVPDSRSGYFDGNFLLSEIEVLVTPAGGKATPVKLKSAQADHEQAKFPVAHAIDGKPATAWSVDGDIVRGGRTAVFTFAAPVEKADKSTFTVRLKQGIKGKQQQFMTRARVSFTDVAEPKLDPVDAIPADVMEAMTAAGVFERAQFPLLNTRVSVDDGPAVRATALKRDVSSPVVTAYFRWIDPQRKPLWQKFMTTSRQAKAMAANGTAVMVMQEMAKPRDTYLLKRGLYDHPDKSQKLQRGLPAALYGGKSQPKDRLELARWLVSAENPLTARVTVNRFWQQLFGVGLVKTSEDFGLQGEWPAHPELLDWLATEFVRSGWDVKAFHKLLVTSATYRQSSAMTAQQFERDPENRLLARGPRFRLDALAIRDNALAASGLLVPTLGGKPVKPYQPPGLWEELAFSSKTSLDKYVQDSGESLYRRTLYSFWKRTVPPPALAIFDAGGREICTVRTSRTNTPLQALNLLNDVTYVEAARVMAARVVKQGGATPRDRLAYAFKLATARTPTDREADRLASSFATYLLRFQQDVEAAKKLISVGESPATIGDASELAAYTMICNVILNLDETVTKE